jgi:predicted acyltransferase
MRIAVCYLVAWGIRRLTGSAGQALLAIFLLALYWYLMTRVPLPDGVPPNLDPETNLGAWLDRRLLAGHLWKQSRTWDPEGLLSTLPAIATTLLGLLFGGWLRSDRSANRKTGGLLLAGLELVFLGLAWSAFFPINKNLWTSSYVLFTGGMAAYLFGLLYWIADVRGTGPGAGPS